MSVPKTRVPITLDKKRHIAFTFNALCDVEKAIGFNPFTDNTDDIELSSPTIVRAFLWAGLRHEDPTLTLEKVGDILGDAPGGFMAAVVGIAQALEAAMPDVEVGEATEGKAPGGQ